MARSDLAKIDADLAERAKSIREQIGTAESRRITIDSKEGMLMGPGGLNLGDEQNIIVVDFCTVNRYYDRPFDPSTPMPPACMAVGDIIRDMVPEDGVPAPQSELCRTCWANEWESDAKGKGKACKNGRELAVVLADELEDPEIEPEMYVISCSPTSIKSFDAAAGKVLQLFNGPPIKAILNMRVMQVGNYYNLSFGQPVANPYIERVYPLLEETGAMLSRMPAFTNYEEPKKLPHGDIRAK